jgi:hypothetical protein
MITGSEHLLSHSSSHASGTVIFPPLAVKGALTG